MSFSRSAFPWLALLLSVALTACPSTEDPLCGNGIVEAPEACDDGNRINDDACSNTCQLPVASVCGNGVVEGNEQCDDGNTTPGDGCGSDCRLPGAVATCAGADQLPRPQQGSCDVTEGSNGAVLITGVVLSGDATYRGGQVLYDAEGVLQCVGCGCDSEAAAAEATQLVCPEVVVSPGLINTHDHLTYQAGPSPRTEERYEHRHDWRTGANNHTRLDNGGSASTDARVWGELRQIVAGTTSLNGSGHANGLVRNLDRDQALEGLDVAAVNYETFPLGSNDQLIHGCNYPVTGPDRATGAFTPHVAEGIEESARNELRCLYGAPDAQGRALMARTAIVHAVAATAVEAGWLAEAGTSVIWSPRTNISLYGDTAPAPVFHRLGVNLALGTDWIQSGSMNMLRELQCADSLNRDYWGQPFTDEDLWRMATSNAADALQVGHVLGRLRKGYVADLALFTLREHADNPHRAVVTAGSEDVVLTVRGGRILFGEAHVADALEQGCETVDVCGSTRVICIADEPTKSFSALQSSQQSAYPLFACGEPENEPTCLPSRVSTNASWPASTFGSSVYSGVSSEGDRDGDGVPDAQDNCPSVFNPIRPMDFGVQADVDGDGLGDLCDPCPLNEGDTCQGLTAGDRDGDGVPDDQDVCPLVWDDQTDSDGDGIGDACDLCPSADVEGEACAVAVPDFKQQVSHTTLMEGIEVRLDGVVVTGVALASNGGFFVQMPTADPNAGRAWQGVFVFAPYQAASGSTPGSGPTDLNVGDIVNVTGVVQTYYGQVQLSNATWEKAGSSAPPAPVQVSATDLAEVSGLALSLEGVLVEVTDVEVTDIAPPVGGGDRAPTGEFVVSAPGATSGIRIDNFIHTGLGMPELGDAFASITGVLTLRNDHFKIEPRDDLDLVAGPVRVRAISPEHAFLWVGDVDAVTVPGALTVMLDRVVDVATPVEVTVDAPGVLSVAPAVVPAGASEVALLLTGHAAGVASLQVFVGETPARTATVEVLAADRVSVLESFSASSGIIDEGNTLTLTVGLDVPTLNDLPVSLSSALPASLTVPAQVVVPAGQQAVAVEVVAGTQASGVVVSASLDAVTLEVEVDVVPPSQGGLVINEIDYDQPQTDDAEFIEIYNAGTLPIPLAGKELVFINGSGTGSEYDRVDLSLAAAVLQPGQFLVVKPEASGVTVPAGALLLTAGSSPQNGAPDAVAIWDADLGEWVDRLSYEGEAFLNGQSMQEGPTDPEVFLESRGDAVSSLIRFPDGADTDVNAADFRVTTSVTPGAPNTLN